MQICPNCAYNNRPGVVFCENCGTSLIGSQATAETKSLDKSADESAPPKLDVEVIKDAGVLGSEVFPQNATLRIEVNDGSFVLKFNPQEKETILFGRTDPSTGVTPQVDLTPYAGYRMGVSRRHAEIRRSAAQDNTLELWDLGSSNGTFLNGERLISHRPYVVSDGDEIQLGQLRVRAFFQKEVTGTLDVSKLEPKAAPAEPADGEAVKTDLLGVAKLTETAPAEPPKSAPEAKPAESVSALSPVEVPKNAPEVKSAASAPEASLAELSVPEAKPTTSVPAANSTEPNISEAKQAENAPETKHAESVPSPEGKPAENSPVSQSVNAQKPEGEKPSDEK
ncbi:MAG: FHA domain-containing protein [Anaerolineae bacterium]|nr:MAG: FHA domain-containing protein [Anaerolineae bacterium]